MLRMLDACSLAPELNSVVGVARVLLFVELTVGKGIQCVLLTCSKYAY